jgi:capsular exopolysaccharide synthesis family protein
MATNSTHETGDADEVSLNDIFDKYIPYWPWFVLLVIVALSGAWFYLRYKNPVYQTTASILVKDEKKGVGAMDPLEAFDMFGGKKSVENEVEILQSKTLMQEVVQNLHLYAPVTIKGRVHTANAYVASPIMIKAKFPDSLKTVLNVPFEYNASARTVLLDNVKYPVDIWVTTPYGVLMFTKNENYRSYGDEIESKATYSFALNNIKNTANSLLKQLTVAQSGKLSTVINIKFDGEIPQRNEDILKELLKVYNQAAILDKNILAANTLKFVDDRLKFVVHELDSVEGSLQNFRSSNKLTDVSAQGQIFLQTVAANDKQISDINMQLAILDQVSNYVNSNKGLGGIVPSTLGVTDPTLTDLLQKLSDLELQYEQTKKIVPENNPNVVSLVDGIAKIKPAIVENISNQRKNLQAAKADLAGTNEKYSAILSTIPQKERELLSISRQQGIKNNIYTFLLQKREETALSFASAIADTRIIDLPETSNVPVSPKSKMIYLGAFLGALAMGVVVIYLKDLFTKTVQSRAEVEKVITVPILGEVGFDPNRTPIVIAEGKRSFIAEQFRQLRTSLGYLGIDDTHKRILITSSISGEGKSFIAINLGISLSLMGKRVVVLELDLRKPKLSEVFSISRAVGISNYLVGKKVLSEILKETGIPNLVLLPSGPIPPNPSELISNGRLEEMLDELEKQFDYIIIDTAPTSPVTDAFLVSPMADVSVYVVRHDYTPKMFLPKLEQFKENSRLNNPAIVYNGVRGKGIGKYGYGYGYGYTEDENNRKWWQRIFNG